MQSLLRRLLAPIFLLATALPSVAQRVEWATIANQQPQSYGRTDAISATDSRGNTYTWQTFDGPTAIGSASLTTTPNRVDPVTGTVLAWNRGLCLAKFRANGQLAWVVQSRNGPHEYVNYANGLAVDERGNVYVSGYNMATDPVDFHLGTTAGAGLTDGTFLARVDSGGTVQWVHHLSDFVPNNDVRCEIAQVQTDNQGNCVLLGYARNTPTVGGQPLTITNRYDGFVAKCNSAGQFQWLRQLFYSTPADSSGSQEAYYAQLAVDAAGNCTVAGAFYDTLTVGAGGPRLTPPAGPNIDGYSAFVARLDRDGHVLWTRQGTGAYFSAVANDAFGNTYLTSYASNTGPTVFGPLTAMLRGGGMFTLKYDPAGTEAWLRGVEFGRPTYGRMGGLNTDADGNVYIGGHSNGPLAVGPYTLPATNTVYSNGFVLSYAPDGSPRWLTGLGGAGQDEAGRPGLDADHRVYVLLASDSAAVIGGQPVPGAYHGLTLVRLTQRANQLAGTVYLDQNANGRRDSADRIFPRPVVLTNLADGQLFTADSYLTGRFQAFTDTGAWVVQPARLPAYYTLSQPNTGRYAGRFNTYGGAADTLDFGLVPVGQQPDLRVTLTPYGATRPGFRAAYQLTLENVGTTPLPAGTATLTLDPRAVFVRSYPAAPVTASGGTVTWAYDLLAPFERRYLTVVDSLPPSVPGGTLLTTTANAPVAGDTTLANNSDSVSQIVTGSFDPNDLLVSRDELTLAQVAAGQLLEYTIRFQNVGTDTAFAVVITDTLDVSKLDLSDLQLIASSHATAFQLGAGGALTVRLPGIELPHDAVNPLGSQGFVRFRVRPLTTLVVGDTIFNRARIVFDFNSPVQTNTVHTVVVGPAGLPAKPSAANWSAYPNPTAGPLRVTAELPTGGTVQLALLDLAGRVVQQATVSAAAGAFRHVLDARAVAPGLYVLRLRLPDGRVLNRQVVRQ